MQRKETGMTEVLDDVLGLEKALALFTDGLARLEAPLPEEMVLQKDRTAKLRTLALSMIQLLRARKANELHLEPVWENGVTETLVRMRGGGALGEVCRLPAALLPPLVKAWKQLADIATDDSRTPQKGDIQLQFGDQQARFHIASIPTIYGEALTVHAIPTTVSSMEELFPDPYLTIFRHWASRRKGLIIFSGPAGSGKSTSLVSCLCEHVKPSIKAIAVEPVVQYLLPGVMQLRIEDYTLEEALQAVEDHGADAIMVGDIYDETAARRAVEFAETGRLVFAVMHVYESVSALHQLVEWGAERQLLAMNLVGLTTQALAKKLCPHCRRPCDHPPTTVHTLRRLAREGGYPVKDDAVFYEAPGCPQCRNTGYLGRTVIEQVLEFTQETRLSFLEGLPVDDFRKVAIQYGMRTLFAEGIRMAVEGTTSLEEVYRVTGA
jgi:general secretion pathway protein E